MAGHTPVVKDAYELGLMREAGRITHLSMMEAAKLVRPGATTLELDTAARETMVGMGAVPTFIGYPPGSKYPFQHTTCISINEEIVHGIPSKDRVLKDGDIVSIDIGATYKGYVGDCAITLPVGRIKPAAQRLIDTTRESLEAAIAVMKPGAKITTIGRTVQEYAESRGFSVVRNYCGHGVGRELHEAPQVPNYFENKFLKDDLLLKPGHVLAVEPMLCEGTYDTEVLRDHWTVVTADRKLSAHWENTIAITKDGCEVLTRA